LEVSHLVLKYWPFCRAALGSRQYILK